MAYASVTARIPGNLLSVAVDPGITGVSTSQQMDPLDALNFTFGAASGQVNLFALWKGTLAASTPQSIDLSAINGTDNLAKAFARVVGWLVLNYSTTDGHDLLVDLSGTDAWTAPLDGAAGKIAVKPGFVDPRTGIAVPGFVFLSAGNTSSYAVSGTSHLISLDPGSNSFYARLYAIGRDA